MDNLESGSRKHSPRHDYDAMRPFAQWIRDCPPQPSLKLPHLDKYSGNADARDHLQSFTAMMSLVSDQDDILCKSFACTLTGAARSWFMDIEKSSIDSFSQLKRKFLEYFATAGKRKKTLSDLANLVQGKTESTTSFYNRFREMADSIEERLTDREIIVCFTNGHRSDALTYELAIRAPRTKSDLYHLAHATGLAEEQKKQRSDREDKERDRSDRRDKKERDQRQADTSAPPSNGSRGRNRTRGTDRSEMFTPLTMPLSEILSLVDLPPPKPLRENPRNPRDTAKYCAYHKDNGHDTNDCFSLKKMVQKWIDEGKLDRYVMRKDLKRPRENQNAEDGNRPPRARLNVIREEIPSNTKLKEQIHELSKVYHIPPWVHQGEEIISFSPNELAGNKAMREQPLVIKGRIDNCESERLLIDSGAAKDVLYYSTFKSMDLPDSMLSPYNGRLEGFTNHKAEAKGTVDLLLEVGDYPYRASATITFIVMDLTSDYHAILGAPSQGRLGLVASLPHQRVKFPTPSGIGCVLGAPKDFLEHVMKTRKRKQADTGI